MVTRGDPFSKNLHVSIDGQAILKGFNLTVPKGEVHAIMGPNGTGKSTLAKALAGHEAYEITGGKALLDGADLVGLEPDEIARAGLFMAFQRPPKSLVKSLYFANATIISQ